MSRRSTSALKCTTAAGAHFDPSSLVDLVPEGGNLVAAVGRDDPRVERGPQVEDAIAAPAWGYHEWADD